MFVRVYCGGILLYSKCGAAALNVCVNIQWQLLHFYTIVYFLYQYLTHC